MRTLRDEWRRMTDAMWQHLYTNQFFSKYGDYRVVEGVLCLCGEEPDYEVALFVTGDGFDNYVEVGDVGDRVKLILPPEEKELSLDGAREQILEAQLEATRGREFQERDRADRYEKALREIAERDEEAMPLSTEYQLTKMLCAVATLAREALDDSA